MATAQQIKENLLRDGAGRFETIGKQEDEMEAITRPLTEQEQKWILEWEQKNKNKGEDDGRK